MEENFPFYLLICFLNTLGIDYENVKNNKELKIVEQKMMVARENKARSGATLEGLENRKKDLVNALKNDLNIDPKNLLEQSDLKNVEDLPNVKELELSDGSIVDIEDINLTGIQNVFQEFSHPATSQFQVLSFLPAMYGQSNRSLCWGICP